MIAAAPSCRIVRFADAAHDEKRRWLPGIEQIFFASSATQHFTGEGARVAFHDRWLGRYLRNFPGECFIAADASGAAAGYIAGCPDSAAACEMFQDIEYYQRFRRFYASYPAHFHVNVNGASRGRGIGADLLMAFCAHCREKRLAGMHAITDAASPATGFYESRGLSRVAGVGWRGRTLVMLGARSR